MVENKRPECLNKDGICPANEIIIWFDIDIDALNSVLESLEIFEEFPELHSETIKNLKDSAAKQMVALSQHEQIRNKLRNKGKLCKNCPAHKMDSSNLDYIT